ncbi:MAG: hypothetical protein V4574_08700 [Pseudomonadota bacterium]
MDPQDFKAEYLLLQTFLENYRWRTLMIKVVSAFLLSAGIGFGAISRSIVILALTAVVAAFLGLLETISRGAQRGRLHRIRAIEKMFADGFHPTTGPFQILRYERKVTPPSRTMAQLLVRLQYGAVIVAATTFAITLALWGSRDTETRLPPSQALATETPASKAGPANTESARRPATDALHDSPDGRIRPRPSPSPTGTPQQSPPSPMDWLPILVALGTAGGLCIWLMLRIRHLRADEADNGQAPESVSRSTVQVLTEGGGSFSAVVALGAAMTAWASVSKTGMGVSLALPLLITPLAAAAAARFHLPKSWRRTLFALSALLSVGWFAAHFISADVARQPLAWLDSFTRNFPKEFHKLSNADVATLCAALFGYAVAMTGAGIMSLKGK